MELMNVLPGIETTCNDIKETIQDLLTANRLNLKAIQVSEVDARLVQELTQILDDVEDLIQTTEGKRLELLIASQVSIEDSELRKERMSEYEDIIHQKRRMVADKQGLFQAFIDPSKKLSQIATMRVLDEDRIKEKQRKSLHFLGQYKGKLEEIKILNLMYRRQNYGLAFIKTKSKDLITQWTNKIKQCQDVQLHTTDDIEQFVQNQFKDLIEKKKMLKSFRVVSFLDLDHKQIKGNPLAEQLQKNKKLMEQLRMKKITNKYLSQQNQKLMKSYGDWTLLPSQSSSLKSSLESTKL